MRDLGSDSRLQNPLLYISLRDVLAPFFRRKRVFVTIFLAVLIAFVLSAALIPPKFTSHMAILVNRERIDPLVTTGGTTQLVTDGNPVSEEEINSEAELLKSSDVLEKVVRANGLQQPHGGSLLGLLRGSQDEEDRVEHAVRTLAENLKVEAAAKTDLINVTYGSSDPRLSYGVLKTLGALYLEKHVAVHRPAGSYEFFSQETQKYHQSLEDAENRLKTFEEQQGAAAPDLERTDMAVQVTNSIGQMHSTEQAIAAAEERIQSDRQQMQMTPQRSATKRDVNAANLLLEQLGAALLTAQTKRHQLLLKYESTYPLVQEADQEVADAENAIALAEKSPYVNQETDRDPTFELLREDLAKTEGDVAAQRANLAAVKRSVQTMQSQLVDLDQKSVTQQDLLRDVKADEDNYLLYLSKREQERTSDALDKTRIANVAIAIPPAIPALPTHSFVSLVLGGIGFSLFLAICGAYVCDYLDPAFHSPAQVVDTLGIPVVVAIPKRTA